MGSERDHGFACPVMGLQKSRDAHGVSSPPAGPAQVDRVILGNIDIGLQRRTGIGIQFFLGFLRTGIVISGVLPDGLQLENVGPGEFLDLLRDLGGVADLQIDNAVGGIILSGAGIIDDQRLGRCSQCCQGKDGGKDDAFHFAWVRIRFTSRSQWEAAAPCMATPAVRLASGTAILI